MVFENCRLSCSQLDMSVNSFANALADRGVGNDSRVAVQLPNLPQTAIAYYAVLKLGAQVVFTNPLYVEREIEHLWNDAEVETAVVGDWLYSSRLEALRPKFPVKNFIVTGIADYLRFPLNWLAPLKLKRENLVAKVEHHGNEVDGLDV